MRHTLSILLENRFGELARIVGLFGARGYNIESLTVAETLDPRVSRITLVTSGDDRIIEQLIKQLGKQIRVLSVNDLTVSDHIEREMVLVHVHTETAAVRHQVLSLANIFRARVIDVSTGGLIVEATGSRKKVTALLDQLEPLGIQDMVRAGTLAIVRSATTANRGRTEAIAV